MSGKAASKLHEKHQAILANILREEENKFCADCLAKGPRWASWNLGVFLCIRCAGIHRNLGVHISRVKSVNLDSWTPEQIEAIQGGGNGKAKDKYEANLPASFRRPQDDYSVEQFIRNKYERKLFISRKEQAVAKATETPKEQEKAKGQAKEPKKSSQRKEPLLSVPRPAAHTRRSSTPPAPHSPHTRQAASSLTTPLPPMHQAASAPDLMSLEAKKQPQPVLDLLTDLPTTTTSSSSSSSSPQAPSLGEGVNSHSAVKDNILSLYNAHPSGGYQSFTAHGHPVHSYYYQQQQQAAMRMAQQQQAAAAMRMAQVKEVEEQMRQLKMRQSAQVSVANGQPTAIPQPGGQTLSPHLW